MWTLKRLSAAVADPRLAVVGPFIMPPLVVFFSNATVIVLAVGALGAVLLPGGFSFRLPKSLRPVAAAFAAMVLWATLSAIWSIDPAQSLLRVAKVAALALCGLILLRAALELSAEARRQSAIGLLAGLCLAVGFLLEEVLTGGFVTATIHPTLSDEPNYFKIPLQSGAGVLAILAWPGALLAARLWSTAAAAVFVALTGGLIVHIGAGTAFVCFVVGGLAAALVFLHARFGLLSIAAVAGLAVVSMPLLTGVLSAGPWMRNLPESVLFSIYHRSKIWEFTSGKVMERPLLGWGMDSARSIPGAGTLVDMSTDLGYDVDYSATDTIPPYQPQAQVLPLHPHNGSLQLWLELGVVGASIGAILAMLGPLAIYRAMRTRAGAAARASTFAAAFVVASSSYGIWQSWWLATLWIVAAVIVSLPDTEDAARTPPAHADP